MRIIGGQFSGRTLLPPPSDVTRPITDRAKQSLFDALATTISFDHVKVLDCFSGTGSMGLECLSRGAGRVVFIERDRPAVKVLKQNIQDLDANNFCTVLPIDAYAWDTHLISAGGDAQQFDLVFVDPPYQHMESGQHRQKVDKLIAGIVKNTLVDAGLVMVRHHAQVSVDAAALGVNVVRELTYGEMAITWLAKH